MSQLTNVLSPELMAVINAAELFVTNLGPDPAKLALTAGPALGIFVNTVALQGVPAMNSVWSVAQADALAKLAALKAKFTPVAPVVAAQAVHAASGTLGS